jgi:phosphoribosyl-ATP pyrophosphohydrolase
MSVVGSNRRASPTACALGLVHFLTLAATRIRPDVEMVSPPSTERLQRLSLAIAEIRDGARVGERTAKLIAAGSAKMAKKVMEEAAEVAIDAVRGEREGVIHESVDLFYNLVVLWSALGIEPDDVWAEMDRREALFGMVEKLPKGSTKDD